jgi:hypothetical protein
MSCASAAAAAITKGPLPGCGPPSSVIGTFSYGVSWPSSATTFTVPSELMATMRASSSTIGEYVNGGTNRTRRMVGSYCFESDLRP